MRQLRAGLWSLNCLSGRGFKLIACHRYHDILQPLPLPKRMLLPRCHQLDHPSPFPSAIAQILRPETDGIKVGMRGRLAHGASLQLVGRLDLRTVQWWCLASIALAKPNKFIAQHNKLRVPKSLHYVRFSGCLRSVLLRCVPLAFRS